ncbi:unnamed protein product [Polarella glacialis]|uniref:Uncharacterized protein n=1 Tax=Polarella glacialis TaxID=89957 RepID=A0A813FU92_POLGL|nr:unnamed protein product [Polarella glacialis]
MGDEATAYEKAFAPIQREKSASDDSSRAAPDLPAYALRVVPPSRGGGGLFFLRGEKRDILSTGKGGGFNDRTIADKVEHNSDDELIDEFGRKKKKRKTAAPKSGEKAAAKESKPRAQNFVRFSTSSCMEGDKDSKAPRGRGRPLLGRRSRGFRQLRRWRRPDQRLQRPECLWPERLQQLWRLRRLLRRTTTTTATTATTTTITTTATTTTTWRMQQPRRLWRRWRL